MIKQKRIVCVLLALAMLTPICRAEGADWGLMTKRLVPLGSAVGVELLTAGVLVVDVAEVDAAGGGVSPAAGAGLESGDIITHISGVALEDADELISAVRSSGGAELELTAQRGDSQLELRLSPALSKSEGCYKLGAYVKSGISGIGTMTFYDPESGVFGALGHGVSGTDGAALMPLGSGRVLRAGISSVLQGQSGQPGELVGAFSGDEPVGNLYANTDFGIFGVSAVPLGSMPALPIASGSEVYEGPAAILSSVDGHGVRAYRVEIVKRYPEGFSATRNMMIKITDPELLEKTGGIVRGMSGSPIIQNGTLVGAVTHVLVADPTRGYGVYIENMLEAAFCP